VEIAAYGRRAPEGSIVRQVVRENLEEFIALADGRGRGLPAYVKQSFRGYLDCGDLGKGFARVRCPDCGHDAVVAFS
jgi:hypothetical protein